MTAVRTRKTFGLAAILTFGLTTAATGENDWLSGPELQEKIVGGTVSGLTLEGYAWSETYRPDGVLIVLTHDGRMLEGRWVIDDDFMCASFSPDLDADTCWAMRLDGNEITYITEHGVNPETGVLSFEETTVGAGSSGLPFLTEEELRTQIIGGTITGYTADEATWSETYHPDGRFEGTGVDGGVLSGRWEIDDSFLCVLYDGDPVASCWALQLDGDQIRYVSEHGSDGGHGTLTRD